MTNRAVMQQALECIERLNMRGFILADFEDEVESAITALREALAQPEQEPTPWRDMVVATLVREGINKHRARELADHFAAQPAQEPVAYYHPRNGFYWAKPTSIFAPTVVDVPPMHLYTTPPAAQPEQQAEPKCEHCHGIGKTLVYGIEKSWEENCLYCNGTGITPAAQRKWQGLTGEEVQFYIKKHSKLVNAGYDKVTDTNLVAKTFDSTGFYKEVSTVLKERNT